MIRFIHAADVHLDSPLVGLEQYGDTPVEEIRGATRRACENLVALAIKENASFVILAGDLYDGDWKDYNTGIFLARQMARLKGAGIRVFIAAGNHDAASQITKSLQLPDNVYVFSHRKAESIPLPEQNVVLHGRGFAERIVSDDVTRKFPPARAGMFNIGVLHTSLTGREGHDVYAPCTPDGLRGRGYQYWALGHAHRHEVVARDPWIVYPGSLQGRHIRETGAKGCVVVRVEDGEVREVRHEPVDILRWSPVEVDATGTAGPREVIERAQRALAQEWDRHGGLPVIAHPGIIRTDRPGLAALVREATSLGVVGLECHYPLHDDDTVAYCLALSARFGLAPTGGSDFHGASKPDNRLGRGDGGRPIPDELLEGLRRLAPGARPRG